MSDVSRPTLVVVTKLLRRHRRQTPLVTNSAIEHVRLVFSKVNQELAMAKCLEDFRNLFGAGSQPKLCYNPDADEKPVEEDHEISEPATNLLPFIMLYLLILCVCFGMLLYFGGKYWQKVRDSLKRVLRHIERVLPRLPFVGNLFGAESQQKLLYVPDADNKPDGNVEHEISEPAIFCFLLNEKLREQFDEAGAKIPEMLDVLKDVDKESKITEFETHQSSMGLWKDLKGAFHVFVVFKSTSEADGVYWWSLEKGLNFITLQRSRNKKNVKDKWDGVPRNKVKSIKEDLKGKGTIKDLFALLWAQQVIAEKYHIKKSNCQSFVTFISKRITEEEYEYKGYFKYSPPPENDRDKKMLEFSINLLDSGVNEWHPLFYLILLGNTDLVDKFIKSGQYDINALYKGLNPLHLAIRLEKTKMVQHLLNDHINSDPTRRDKKGMNALHWAGMFGIKTIIDLLLAHPKVKIDDVDDYGRTALYWATYESNVNAVQKLLEKEADPNIVDNKGRSPLNVAAQKTDDSKIIDLLLAYSKVKIDAVDGDGRTALFWAVSISNDIAVPKLLEKGANPNIVDKKGQSPLHMVSNEITADHLIKKGADLHCRDNVGDTPLHLAVFRAEDMKIIDLLLQNINKEDIQQYRNDASFHHGLEEEIVDRLLKKGILITDERTRRFEEEGVDPLMDLMTCYGRRIERAKNWQDIDEILKEEHLDINGRDQKGQTLLFVAVCANNVTGVRLLLERGADPTIRNNNGLTSLHFAAHYARTIETISLILENKQVDINDRDEDGKTALHYAIIASNATAVHFLLDKGADPTIRDNIYGYNSFYLATQFGENSDILNLLYSSLKESKQVGINESISPEGLTALHLAIVGSKVTTVRFLLSNGANPNVVDVEGRTPLHAAVLLAKDMDIVDLLVNHKDVDVNLVDDDGENVLDYAMNNKHGLSERIANLLKEKGAVETENELHTINKGMNKIHSRIFSNKKAEEVANFFSDDNTIPIEAKIDTISEEHLLSAITDSNFEFVRNLLKNGVDMNARGEKGENALHMASRYAKTTDLIDIILEKGKFDINSVDIDGRTCLHHAIMGSYSTNNVPHLLQKGADPSIADKDDHSPLHFAASRAKEIETISLILGNEQVDINHINICGATALHKAIGAKNVEIARCLLEKGADPTIREQTGYTPFHLAAQFLTDTDVLGLMLGNEKKIDIDERNKQGVTALYLATRTSNFDAARFLLAKGANPNIADENGLTPLHLAAKYVKDMNMFKLFVNHKDANINHLDKNGNNALVYAMGNKHGLGKAIANLLRGKGAANAEIIYYHHKPENMAGAGRIKQDSDMETIRFLIENGLDMCVMTGGEIGANAFHVVSAANEKMTEPISFILDPDLYAEPTAPNCTTADDNNENMVKKVLEEAIRNSDAEKVRNLIEMGADLGKTTWRKGMNALHEVSFYAKTTDLIDVVLKTGEFDIDGTENEGFTPLHHAISGINREKNARYLLEKGADPTIADKKGNTPFHFAAYFLTDIHVLGIMLANEKKIDIDEKDKSGMTALHMAIVESNVNVARFLLSNGANPNVADKDGHTPLHEAVMFAKDMDMVKLLVNHPDVDVNYLGNRGIHALYYAMGNEHGLGEEIANLLREKMAVKAEGINHEPKNIAATVPGGIEEDSDIKTVRLLIESGQDISAMTWGENGANALHLAAADEKTTDLIDAILETGKFDINGVDSDGNTPLHYAIKGPKPITINARRLIKMGADPGIADNNGVTPLHMAARNAETMDLIELLLNTEKLNVNDYDHNGLTPLAYARSNKHGLGQRIIDRLEEYDDEKKCRCRPGQGALAIIRRSAEEYCLD